MVSSLGVTALLDDWGHGNRTTLIQLLPLVDSQLRRLASRKHAAQLPGVSAWTASRELGSDVCS